MSDLIKKIKIKKQDGTFTDYIPIGAEAQNVSTSDGDSVQLKLNKKPYYYNTVADMKADTKLKAGDMTITLGYHIKNDGGNAKYIIRDKKEDDVEDNGFILFINDKLVAELVIDNSINIKQFGAKGDGETDDTQAIQKLLQYCKNNKVKLISDEKSIFLISETLDISNLDCDFNNANFKTNKNIDIFTIDSEKYYTYLKNVSIDCSNIANSGINVLNGRQVRIDNFTIKNVYNYGFNYESGYELIVNKGNINNGGTNAIGIRCMSSDSHFSDIIIKDMKTGVYNRGTNFFTRVHGWIYKQELLKDSKMFLLDSTWAYINSCYSDTYHYSYYSKNWGKAKITNSVTYYNPEAMTENTFGDTPYLYYIEEENSDIYLSFINCKFNGLSNKKCYVSNKEENYIKANFIGCTFNNMTNNKSFEKWNITTTGVTINSNNLIMKNGIRQVEFDILYDLSNGRTLNIGPLPDAYRPNKTFTTIANYSTNEWEVDGVCYCYLSTGGNLSIKLPTSVVEKGTPVYIRGIFVIVNDKDF